MISWSSIGRFSSLYHGSRCARERSENCWNSISFRIVGRATSVCLIVRPRSVDRAISFRIRATSVCLIVRPCIVDRATSVYLIVRPALYLRSDLTINKVFIVRRGFALLIVRPVFA